LTGPVLPPAGDPRDAHRALVDQAVRDFGVLSYGWTAQQVRQAQRLCYRTVWTECDWWLYASPKVPGSIDIHPNDGYPPSGGDHLSVGLYQQQMPWYPVATAMDATLSTRAFLRELMATVPDWMTAAGKDEATVCQRVQRSQFDGVTIDPATGKPFVFAANYRARENQTNALALDGEFFAHHPTGVLS
jgi:hypothetical protein